MNHIATTLQKQGPDGDYAVPYTMGNGVFPLGAEGDHSPCSVDVKNTRIFTSTPSLCLHGAVLN
jgi:hypothetical protein